MPTVAEIRKLFSATSGISYNPETGQFIATGTVSSSILNVTLPPYNAVGDGETDCTAAFQAALNTLEGMLNSIENPIIYAPKGQYLISDDLVSPNSASFFTIQGDGENTTSILWNKTTSGGDMLRLINPESVKIKDISFVGNNTNVPDSAINFHRTDTKIGDVGFVADCLLENVGVPAYLGRVKRCVTVTSSGANNSDSDQNNEQGEIHNCHFENGDEYGLSFEMQNALWWKIFGGRISGSVAGINNVRDDGTSGGGFTLYGTTVMNLGGSCICFNLTGSQYPIIINNPRSEGGGKFLRARTSTDLTPINFDIVVTDATLKLQTLSHNFDIAGSGNKLTLKTPSAFASGGVSAFVDDCEFYLDGGHGNFNLIEFDNAAVISIDNYKSDAPLSINNIGSVYTAKIIIGDSNTGNLKNWIHTNETSPSGSLSVYLAKTVELENSISETLETITDGSYHPVGAVVTVFNNLQLSVQVSGNIFTSTGATVVRPAKSITTFTKLSDAFGGKWAASV